MGKSGTALITGATSGIGASFAKKLAEQNYDLILTGRRKKILEDFAGTLETKYNIKISLIIAELSIDKDVNNIIKSIQKNNNIQILINNAGFGSRKNFIKDSFENQEKMLKVHINALTRITHAAIPRMIARRSGKIINVSSLAAFLSAPESIFYCATKAFIIKFSESLYIALYNHNIQVQALCPGFTRTDFQSRLKINPEGFKNKGIIRWMDPDKVAKISLKDLRKKSVICIPGINNKILYCIIKLIPKPIYYRLALRFRKLFL